MTNVAVEYGDVLDTYDMKKNFSFILAMSATAILICGASIITACTSSNDNSGR